ncbi:MAG: sodium-dependent transporter [Clostridia bacterium]|nr:sodium-dependent transporter [Clostridia bacterium]
MSTQTKKSSFSGSIGFVLAAAGSAVGVGNIWRFPTLAAKNGGGLFLITYLVLVLTFGFSLLITDIAIGRKTGKSATEALRLVHPKWNWLGKLTFLVPAIILCYYIVIGGWILKYMVASITDFTAIAGDNYFTSFMTSKAAPIFWMLVYMAITAFIVYCGVEKGIERFSKIVMPTLLVLIIGISVFALTLKHTDQNGVTRTGLQGLLVYIKPDFSGVTFKSFMNTLMDAMSQLFFSLSVAMGIMITYGSYVKKDVDLNKSVTQIEIFDTAVAFLAGLMVIPTVFVFQGLEGMKAGPGLIFISLPKVFEAMGIAGRIVGPAFFIMVAFAALTSSVSIMEAIVGSLMESFKSSRKKISIIVAVAAATGAVLVCLGYNALYFELTLPNGSTGQLLDALDYLTNNLMMPIVSICTCVLIGWIVKPKWVMDEIESSGRLGRKKLYVVMIKYLAPALMVMLLLQAFGVFNFLRK